MQTVRMTATIPTDRVLVLRMPEDTPVGVAEIVVTIDDKSVSPGPRKSSFVDYVDGLRQRPRKTRPIEDIDREIETQRDSWE